MVAHPRTLELVDGPSEFARARADGQAPPRAPVRGRLAGLTPDGRVLVAWGAQPARPAALAISGSHRALLDAIRAGRDVLLDFIEGDPFQPVVLGLLRDRLSLDDTPADVVSEPRVELRATERLVLSCGEAAVELCEDGRVTVRGTHVETRSTGAMKIKGASVAIN